MEKSLRKVLLGSAVLVALMFGGCLGEKNETKETKDTVTSVKVQPRKLTIKKVEKRSIDATTTAQQFLVNVDLYVNEDAKIEREVFSGEVNLTSFGSIKVGGEVNITYNGSNPDKIESKTTSKMDNMKMNFGDIVINGSMATTISSIKTFNVLNGKIANVVEKEKNRVNYQYINLPKEMDGFMKSGEVLSEREYNYIYTYTGDKITKIAKKLVTNTTESPISMLDNYEKEFIYNEVTGKLIEIKQNHKGFDDEQITEITTLTYDSKGRLVRETNSKDYEVEYVYNDNIVTVKQNGETIFSYEMSKGTTPYDMTYFFTMFRN